ncbi:MAG: alkaline phosphatase family protein [Deltaproteobacteria bacterium]|nr:alkaline phosphatase family protein [Deltaproteobacteria bacterium]
MTEFKKIAFVGLDGVPYSLLKRFFELQVMPGLNEIASNGTFVPMNSSLPPISSVAWTSFMTGVDPGYHGIFGFTDVANDEIRLELPSFDDIKTPVIWNQYPQKRSIIINLPFTYPARPLNGILVTGFVSPIFERAIYPNTLVPWLKSRGYKIDTDNVRARQNRAFLIDDLFFTLQKLEEVVFNFVKQPWDIFIFVIAGTDRLNHFLFDALKNESHPYHGDTVSYYRKVDSFVSRFFQRLDSGTRRVVLSDHGFTDLKIHVNLNYLLRILGYLSFKSELPRDISDINPKSLAFAMDPTRIYVNSRSRFKDGTLNESQARELVTRLKNELSSFRVSELGALPSNLNSDSNDVLFTDVKTKDEIYKGPQSEFAPDLVVIPKSGYDVKASVNAKTMIHEDIFTGSHTYDDAFLIVGDKGMDTDLIRPEVSHVIDLVPWKRPAF